MRCIHALLQQDFPARDFEIVIVSDGYDGSTFEVAGRFNVKMQPAVRYYNLTQKSGPAAARNRGWQQALGELIVFTDDDCVPDSGWLSAIWNKYKETGLSEAAFSGRTIVPISTPPTDYELNIANLEKAEFITANCAVTKKALLKVGGLDERFKMAWREDSDLQFKLIEKGVNIFKVETAIVTHPVRKAKWGISIKEEKKGIFNALLYKKYPTLYKQKIRPEPPWHYYFIIVCLITAVIGLVIHNEYVAVAGGSGWLLGTLWFTIKRLSSTSRSADHIAEMLFTSMIIPLLSLYYRIYGSLKYGVMLIP